MHCKYEINLIVDDVYFVYILYDTKNYFFFSFNSMLLFFSQNIHICKNYYVIVYIVNM